MECHLRGLWFVLYFNTTVILLWGLIGFFVCLFVFVLCSSQILRSPRQKTTPNRWSCSMRSVREGFTFIIWAPRKLSKIHGYSFAQIKRRVFQMMEPQQSQTKIEIVVARFYLSRGRSLCACTKLWPLVCCCYFFHSAAVVHSLSTYRHCTRGLSVNSKHMEQYYDIL